MPRVSSRLTKKELKEDKLVTYYYKALELFELYKKQIYIATGIFVLVVIAVVIFLQMKKSANDEASAKFLPIATTYDSGNYIVAIEGDQATNTMGLKSFVEKYGSTESGQTAKVYLGNSYLFMGNFDDALKAFDGYSGSNEVLKAAAYAGAGSALEGKGNKEEALKNYVKAYDVSKSNVLNPVYMLAAGRLNIELGKKDKAVEILRRAKADFPRSTMARDIDRYLAIAE